MGTPPRKSYLFAPMTAKSGPPRRLIGRLRSVNARLLGVLLLSLVACGPATVPIDAPSSPPLALPTASPDPSATATAAPTPTPLATPEPTPRITREMAGVEFALVRGAADLRVEAALSRDDEAAAAATVAADVPAVESEFERTFAARPVIYVFGSTESYADGFVRIFGYPASTATFVAENSVSFFEPSLRLIAVNWAAVGDRRPVAAIRHELTHLLTLDACSPRCDLVPAWLNEGQARLAEALVPGGEWRLLRVRDEAASMALTGSLIPLNSLVSQLAWNGLTDWVGYFKYQESARAVELLREDIGGTAPIARVYERLRSGQNLAQAYAALTDRSFNDFVAGAPRRPRRPGPAGKGPHPSPPAEHPAHRVAPPSTVPPKRHGRRRARTWPP